MQTSIDLEFADGQYTFKLPTPQIDELQTKTGKGIGRLFAVLIKGVYQNTQTGEKFVVSEEADYSRADVVEPIRQGLIGGGRGMVDGQAVVVTPLIANRLIDHYVSPRPLEEALIFSATIVSACVKGYEPPAEKKTASPAKTRPTRKAGSTTHAPSPTAP